MMVFAGFLVMLAIARLKKFIGPPFQLEGGAVCLPGRLPVYAAVVLDISNRGTSPGNTVSFIPHLVLPSAVR